MSECGQRESEQLANEGTNVNEGWKVVSIYFVFFTGIFGMRKVQCYLSVQVTVLLEIYVSTFFSFSFNEYLCQRK